MFFTINGLLTDRAVQEVLTKGFECLGELNPMLDEPENIIVSSKGSADKESIIWRLYSLKDNQETIIPLSGDAYTVTSKAKPFVTLTNREDFIQIDAGVKAFNHYAAIKLFIEFYN